MTEDGTVHEIERTNWLIDLAYYSCAALVFGSAIYACLFSIENKWHLLWIIYAASIPADMVSGSLHWLFDSYVSPTDHPLVSRPFRVFKIHHDEPDLITKHDAHAVDYETLLVALVLNIVLYLCGTPTWESPFWAMVCVWGGFTNRFHCWSHIENPPKLARVLQKLRLVLTTKHHDEHHAAPQTRYYCISNGVFTNPMLEVIAFWPTLEWIVYKLTGAKAVRQRLREQEA